MSDRPGLARPRRVRAFSRLYFIVVGPRGGVRLIVLIALLILGIVIGSRIYGRRVAADDLADREATIQLLQSEGEKLESKYNDQLAQVAVLTAKLTSARAALDAVMPTENIYNISPNQSLIVGDGHLNMGLIGSPANESITLNINGKQHSVTAGDVLRVTPDPSTVCQIAVRSFDMFKAVINASCDVAEPR